MKLFLFFMIVMTVSVIATEDFIISSDSLENFVNPLANMKVGLILPFLLLFMTIIASFMDYGAIGVSIGSAIGIVVGWLIQIIPVNFVSLVGFLLIILIMVWRLSR